MSATNRAESVRRPHDAYFTPIPLIEQAIAEVVSIPVGGAGDWLDPAWGDGRFARVIKARYPEAKLYGAEQADLSSEQPPRVAFWRNFYEIPDDAVFDRIVTNPPYSLAEEYIAKFLPLLRVEPIGQLVLLLRLPFAASVRRYGSIFTVSPPSSVYVIPRRPSFTNGGTDATDYAWFVWKACKGMGVRTELRWLPPIEGK